MLSKTPGDRAEKVRNVFVSEFIASSLRDLRQRMERLKKESGCKGTQGCSTGFFGGDTSQVWALITSPWVKIWKKSYHNCIIQRWKFLMIWFLLLSEWPWQRNDAITFFIYLCVSLYQEFVRAIRTLIMAKFEQILWERFRNIVKRSFKHHINSEIACYPHN